MDKFEKLTKLPFDPLWRVYDYLISLTEDDCSSDSGDEENVESNVEVNPENGFDVQSDNALADKAFVQLEREQTPSGIE